MHKTAAQMYDRSSCLLVQWSPSQQGKEVYSREEGQIIR